MFDQEVVGNVENGRRHFSGEASRVGNTSVYIRSRRTRKYCEVEDIAGGFTAPKKAEMKGSRFFEPCPPE